MFLSRIFNHKWHLDEDQSTGINMYYACKKTGDRKVVSFSGIGYGYQPIDHAWLQSGSGKYSINGKVVDTVANPSLAVSTAPPSPPLGLPATR